MTSPPGKATTLEGIRREIDGIDDAIADLLIQRMDASNRIKAEKSTKSSRTLPVRPAREAQILRRLIDRSRGKVPTDLLVRIWREILMSSTLAQASLTVHISSASAASPHLLSLIRDHFCNAPIRSHSSDAEVIAAVSVQTGNMGVVSPEGGWCQAMLRRETGDMQVMGVLPIVNGPRKPDLLMVGCYQAEPSGSDHTLLVSGAALPDPFPRSAIWQVTSGSVWLTCLAGFIVKHDPTMAALSRQLGEKQIRIAGNYPAPIEARP